MAASPLIKLPEGMTDSDGRLVPTIRHFEGRAVRRPTAGVVVGALTDGSTDGCRIVLEANCPSLKCLSCGGL